MRRLLLALVLVGALVAAGCGGSSSRSGSPAGTLGVVAAFYPLAWAAERVGGADVAVTNLTPVGTEPHELELTPKARQAIDDADVVLVMGDDFQPAVESAAGDNDAVTEVLRTVNASSVAGGPGKSRRDHAGHDHDEDTTTTIPSTVDTTPEKPAKSDPHVWLDPVLMQRVVDVVADALARADADNASRYRANAAQTNAELASLDGEFSTRLAQCARRLLVTNHDAFSYLAWRYGLRNQSISALSPDEEPSPARLAELARLVKDTGTTTIFYETLVSPAVAQSLARETGANTKVLNPIEGLTDAQAKDKVDYLSLQRENLGALTGGLGCATA